jgi:hypothetical protein
MVSGVRTFTVLTGPNPNYPNPDSWGLSYHINDEESPVLLLERGVEYTFLIQAGASHPFYLTDDINGGQSNPQEIVFAGGEDAHGTPEAPHELRFTPTAAHPDVFYYQCWIHQRLGWEIRLTDRNTPPVGSSTTTAAVSSEGVQSTTLPVTETTTLAAVTDAVRTLERLALCRCFYHSSFISVWVPHFPTRSPSLSHFSLLLFHPRQTVEQTTPLLDASPCLARSNISGWAL